MGESMIEEKLPVLKVHMLGGFSMEYGDRPISFRRNTATKSMKLLQILLHCGENGISRAKLLENLYGREELADVANNLRVTSHRLKKCLWMPAFRSMIIYRLKVGSTAGMRLWRQRWMPLCSHT